jgi:hypothetical protein
MKNLFILILLFLSLVACTEKKSSGSSASLNSELHQGVWVMGYTLGSNFYEDKMAIVENVAVIKTYCISCGNTEVSSETWYITPVDSDTLLVKDGSDTYNVDYKITGNQLEIHFKDGSYNVYTR